MEETEGRNWERSHAAWVGKGQSRAVSDTREEVLSQALASSEPSSFRFSVLILHLWLPPCSHTEVSFAQLSTLAPFVKYDLSKGWILVFYSSVAK